MEDEEGGTRKPRDAREAGREALRVDDAVWQVGEAAAPPYDIEERTRAFGVRAVRLFRVLQAEPDRAGWVIGRQFLRSATSVGANVAEARAAESPRDFLHKLQVAQKEARESLYWLRLLAEADLIAPNRIDGLTLEADEILRILVAIARNAKRNARS